MIINKEDIKSLLIQAGAIVLATGALAVIAYLFSKGVKSLGNFINWLCQPTPTYNWILLLLSAIVLYSLIYYVVRMYLKPKKTQGKIQVEVEKIYQKQETLKPLEKIEEDILLYLSKNDGRTISNSLMRISFPDIQETRLRYYLTKLYNEGYIGKDHNNFYGLLHPGREYLVKVKKI